MRRGLRRKTVTGARQMSNVKRCWIVARYCLMALLCSAPPCISAQERRFELVDEAAGDASWVSFKKQLLAAVEKRDLKFVLGILDRNVRASIDGTRGVAGFRKAWDVGAADTPLWRELRAALFLGSAYLKKEKGPRELCAPYLLARWPDDLFPDDHGAIITKEVLVKADPSAESPTLQILSYEIVPVTDWEVADKILGDRQRWVKVKVASGEGYVPDEQIRSPIEHSACFIKTGGGWRMSAFAPAGGS
jgi:hypothetical protein